MRNPCPNASAATPAVHHALAVLLNVGRDLLGRVKAAITHRTTAHLPRRFAANPITAEQRLARTLDWIVALARTLAGDRAWLIVPTYNFPRFPGRFPPLTAKLRAECGLPPVPPRTEAQKAAAHRRYVRHVFATQPTAKIAARLARRLDIAKTADAWPTALTSMPHPPAAYARSSAAPARQGSGCQPIAAAPQSHPPAPPQAATGPPCPA